MRTKQHFKYVTGIVVPCYNEEERLQLSEFSRFFKTDNTTYFFFVNDGSIDAEKIFMELQSSLKHKYLSLLCIGMQI